MVVSIRRLQLVGRDAWLWNGGEWLGPGRGFQVICGGGGGNGRGQLELGNQVLFVSSQTVGRVGRERKKRVFVSSTHRENSTPNACLSNIIPLLKNWQAGPHPTDGR